MAMQKINFSSKMFLHTYGIKQDPRDHLSRSISKWNELVEATSIELNTSLDLILDNPENVCWDETSETWFISNLGGEKVTLEEDKYGWITRLDKDRKVISNRWVEGLDAPTGMAAYKNKLYVGDRGVLVEIDISKSEIIRKIPLPGAEFINDVAVSSSGEVYISDTFGNRIYRLSKRGKVDVFLENTLLDFPNGLLVDGKNLIVATWGTITNPETFETSKKGTLLRVDLKSKEITPVGKGKPIANIDGVVKYGEHFYVTDWTGGRLLQVSEEGDVTEVVTGFNQFADLGIDPKRGIVVIPEMSKNRFIMVNLRAFEKP